MWHSFSSHTFEPGTHFYNTNLGMSSRKKKKKNSLGFYLLEVLLQNSSSIENSVFKFKTDVYTFTVE